MANKVFANGREIACKAGAGKSIAAFPDVCLSPPSPPAGPIPLPYPVTAMASDTTKGSKKVKISKKEVILKNKSCIKKCNGDQAATKSFGMGVVTHALSGKVYFSAWSMDVKYEGKNVTRHLDITTHNHNSMPGDTPPWPYLDGGADSNDSECAKDKKRVEDKCSGDPADDCKPVKGKVANNECVKAHRCMLKPYSPNKCCKGQTPHHLIPKRGFKGNKKYKGGKAPCVCAEGHSWHRSGGPFSPKEQTHANLHDCQDTCEAAAIMLAKRAGKDGKKAMNYGQARKSGIKAHQKAFPKPQPACNHKCLKKQLDNYHKGVAGATDSTPINTGGWSRKLTSIANRIAQNADKLKRKTEQLFKAGAKAGAAF